MNLYNGNKNEQKLLHLVRNEGKIKRYESCTDPRAWSCGELKKSNYLKEWMKHNAQITIVPQEKLFDLVLGMEPNRSNKKFLRCRVNCKSAVALDSLYFTSLAIEETLRSKPRFNNHFHEHDDLLNKWGRDPVLEILLRVTLLWNIIVKDILKIKLESTKTALQIPKCRCFDGISRICNAWKRYILSEAEKVRNCKDKCEQCSSIDKFCQARANSNNRTTNTISSKQIDNSTNTVEDFKKKILELQNELNETNIKMEVLNETKLKLESELFEVQNQINAMRKEKEMRDIMKGDASVSTESRTEVQRECVRELCETYLKELNTVKETIDKEKLYIDKNKVNCVDKSTNKIVKKENFGQCYCSKNEECSISLDVDPDLDLDDPKLILENTFTTRKPTSELILTLKNIKNEKYKHVSVFQMLHKSNQPMSDPISRDDALGSDNPKEVLVKVRDTINAIVTREFGKIAEKEAGDSTIEIGMTAKTMEK